MYNKRTTDHHSSNNSIVSEIIRVISCVNTMKGVIETQLLINNKLVSASDNATFDLFSPHTGDLVAKGMDCLSSHD